MTAGLDLHVLVVLGADLAQLESGAHLAVQLVLLLGRLGGGGGAVRKQRGPTAWTTPRDHTAKVARRNLKAGEDCVGGCG